ncbi:hypothetical protein AWM70_18865 [Paenibacillus yonginensis]|uniref:Peptide ABC transporter permease n=1 Tax=Paenibacillus yonginensis TaxID=1462996 RepID=A0A1B1N4L2_9BACL|nr:anti-sigma-F factor Fin family protein [Paenibacillus yonginensis]ANS76380.1 hypothetical protein AWM70_18865 [Paenibacillus yonginensis]
MAVHYVCRHCKTSIGRIDSPFVSEGQLGFTALTPEERRDIIAYDSNGDITVRVTCDYCAEAMTMNPELLLVASPLQ